jgi:SAM-dependent methyltransferase
MNEIVYHSNFKLENTYWWFLGRNNIILEIMGKYVQLQGRTEVLDVGCGTCGFAQMLSEKYKVIGLDTSELALEYCRKRGLSELYCSLLSEFPKENHDIKAITMLDVIEHIEDDKGVVADVFSILPSGGWFIASVPAYSFLWSVHDEIHNHFRRYNKKEIVKLIKEAGFEIQFASYFNSLLFIPGLLKRLFDKVINSKKGEAEVAVEVLPGPVNSLMTSIFKFERKILPIFKFPFGLSILVIARKR